MRGTRFFRLTFCVNNLLRFLKLFGHRSTTSLFSFICRITGQQLFDTVQRRKLAAAPGLDGWRTCELQALPVACFEPVETFFAPCRTPSLVLNSINPRHSTVSYLPSSPSCCSLLGPPSILSISSSKSIKGYTVTSLIVGGLDQSPPLPRMVLRRDAVFLCLR